MITFVVALIDRYINRRATLRVLAGLVVWFLYAGLMGHFGIISNSEMRPPEITFIVVPVLLFLILCRGIACQRTGLIHTEVLDQMISTFPFHLIPGFFVPLAVVLHVLAIRSFRESLAKN